jgi:hypothetical protein
MAWVALWPWCPSHDVSASRVIQLRNSVNSRKAKGSARSLPGSDCFEHEESFLSERHSVYSHGVLLNRV